MKNQTKKVALMLMLSLSILSSCKAKDNIDNSYKSEEAIKQAEFKESKERKVTKENKKESEGITNEDSKVLNINVVKNNENKKEKRYLNSNPILMIIAESYFKYHNDLNYDNMIVNYYDGYDHNRKSSYDIYDFKGLQFILERKEGSKDMKDANVINISFNYDNEITSEDKKTVIDVMEYLNELQKGEYKLILNGNNIDEIVKEQKEPAIMAKWVKDSLEKVGDKN
ncbi:MAG: hypothetical protein Q4B52_05450 [Tissierellia bacterium]|nr:hypothetical protein [Tissierellia bacterium]